MYRRRICFGHMRTIKNYLIRFHFTEIIIYNIFIFLYFDKENEMEKRKTNKLRANIHIKIHHNITRVNRNLCGYHLKLQCMCMERKYMRKGKIKIKIKRKTQICAWLKNWFTVSDDILSFTLCLQLSPSDMIQITKSIFKKHTKGNIRRKVRKNVYMKVKLQNENKK